mgnify:CR=1 FL=1
MRHTESGSWDVCMSGVCDTGEGSTQHGHERIK